jgi:copper chaperone CopZ
MHGGVSSPPRHDGTTTLRGVVVPSCRRGEATIARSTAVFLLAALLALPVAAQPTSAAGARYQAGISGMHCRADCLPEIRAALLGLPEVAEVEIDFNTKRAILILEPGASLTRAKLSAALTDAGYGLTTLDRLP